MQTDIMRPISSIRRKPSYTYKSPTSEEWATFTPGPSSSRTSSPQTPTAAASSRSQDTPVLPKAKQRNPVSFATPLLPLYHPLGQLALSLPPLDPASFGLPLPPLNYGIAPEHGSRSSSRARRRSPQDAAQPPVPADTPAQVSSASTVSAVAAVAAREIKDKASPRKRRTGGGKRKRKDNDSADATYPAKRTRAPRTYTTSTAVVEDDPVHTEEDAAVPEDLEDNEEDHDKRRTTRSRAGLKRKDSVASATSDTSPSKSISPGAPDVPPAEASAHHDDVDMKTVILSTEQQEGEKEQAPRHEEKEEGELSEDGGGAHM